MQDVKPIIDAEEKREQDPPKSDVCLRPKPDTSISAQSPYPSCSAQESRSGKTGSSCFR